MTVLLREAVGERLRRARTAQSRTLRDVSRAARVSLGYLSEVERGRKEASSELLASICGALDLPLPELLVTVAGDLDGSASVVPDVIERDGEIDPERLVSSLESELADGELAGAQAQPGEHAQARASADRLQPMLSQRITAPLRCSSSGVVVAA
jgi:transcriptional regulator with XRE-family HTH domain